MRWRNAVVDAASFFEGLVSTLASNPAYLILAVAGFALLIILLVARRIHKIRSEEIFIHQAWGANWKGR